MHDDTIPAWEKTPPPGSLCRFEPDHHVTHVAPCPDHHATGTVTTLMGEIIKSAPAAGQSRD